MTEKEIRLAFERWALGLWFSSNSRLAEEVERMSDGRYKSFTLRITWEAWQSAVRFVLREIEREQIARR